MKDRAEYPETEKLEKFRLVIRLGETILKNGGEIFRRMRLCTMRQKYKEEDHERGNIIVLHGTRGNR
jgi:hypothetical protein